MRSKCIDQVWAARCMFFAASFACAHSWNKNGIASVGIDIYKLNTPLPTRFAVCGSTAACKTLLIRGYLLSAGFLPRLLMQRAAAIDSFHLEPTETARWSDYAVTVGFEVSAGVPS